MKPELLHVVAVLANPVRWKTRLELFRRFEQHMLDSGVKLTTVECAYGERPFELADDPHINRVRVRARTLVWNKENLLNIGIARLPADWRYVAWVDGDVTFRKSGWAAEAVHALQHYHIVQPWSDAYDLGPHDEHLQAHRSFLRQWWHGEPVCAEEAKWWNFNGGPYHYAQSGYAWAATRQAIEWLGGLFELGAMGAGDHHMALSLVGKAERSVPAGVHPAYLKHLRLWESRALHHINLNLGFLWGTIEHGWHGRKADRAYVDRWKLVIENKFDPDTDLKRNSFGVIELAGNKPGLSLALDRYFRERNEDANSIT